MPEKTKNPFVIEIEKEIVDEPKKVKEVIKPVETRVEVKPAEPELEKVKQEKTVDQTIKKVRRQWGMYFAGMGTMLVFMLIAGGIWWKYGQGWNLTTIVSPPPSPSPIVYATPEPSPEPVVVDRSLITVEVLNGSGVTGKASEILGKIEELGYKRGTTGNAASQIGSSISLSEDISTLSATILADFKEILPGATVTTTPLTGANKIQVILGEE